MRPIPKAEPQPYPSGYTVDLYCDHRLEDEGAEWRRHHASPSFYGKNERDCLAQARKAGWVIHKETRTATCRACARDLKAS